jgi:HSP20 family protein
MRGPFRELARMEQDMEELFQRFLPGLTWATDRERGWMPAVDMMERKDEIVLRADLPGMEQKDIEVTVQDGTLTIRGERREEKEEKKEGEYFWSERTLGAFVRTLPLPANVDADKVTAAFKNGVLDVHLPKTRESKGKKIEIKAA